MANNIYKKLAEARAEFHTLKLKKTGWNPHGKFAFFELGDFLVPAMDILRQHGIIPIVGFRKDYAVMLVKEIDGDGRLEITSPMVAAEYQKDVTDKDGNAGTIYVEQGASLPGCHPIQNLGAVETYQRRYLWVTLMEIVEHDALDSSVGDEPKAAAKTATKKKAAKEPDQEPLEAEITNEAGAGALVDGMIGLVRIAETIKELVSFWNANQDQIDILEKEYPVEYTRLKSAFTIAKERLT